MKLERVKVGLILLVLLIPLIPLIPGYAEESEWIIEERGDRYEIHYNSIDPNQKRWSSAPLWIFNGSDYVPYILQNNYTTTGYFQVQNGRIGVRIYDYYAEFYSPDMEEVRLYSEMWEIQSWTGR